MLALVPMKGWAELPPNVKYWNPTLAVLQDKGLVITSKIGDVRYWGRPQMTLLQAAEALCEVLPKHGARLEKFHAREELLRLRNIIEREKSNDPS